MAADRVSASASGVERSGDEVMGGECGGMSGSDGSLREALRQDRISRLGDKRN